MNSDKSKCPKCGNDRFEIKMEDVAAKEKIHFIRCANPKCLIVVGVVDRIIPTGNLAAIETLLNSLILKIDLMRKP